MATLEELNAKRDKARAKTNKAKKGFTGKEKVLQKQCENYLKLLGIKYLHIPDSLLRWVKGYAPIWIVTIVSRNFKGFPDLAIFQEDKSLLVELKTAKGTLSAGQKRWAKGVNVHVLRDFESFKALVDKTFI